MSVKFIGVEGKSWIANVFRGGLISFSQKRTDSNCHFSWLNNWLILVNGRFFGNRSFLVVAQVTIWSSQFI